MSQELKAFLCSRCSIQSQKILTMFFSHDALEGDVVSTLGYKNQYVKVPEGHCWVEGDHTGHTLDSNTFGPVSVGLINAKAVCIVWPPERWQSLEAKLPENRKPLSLSL
ncbi:unnamed protein product, partial [Brenthis ino]